MPVFDLEHLDREQRAAVIDPAPYVRIIAPAGSGKTTVLANRIAHQLTASAGDGSRIMGVSFTRTAARELHQRLADLEGYAFESTTLHALALRIVSMASERSREFVPRIVSQPISVMERAGVRNPSRSAMARIAAAKARKEPIPASLRTTYETYQRQLRAQRLMDFEDVVSRAADRLESNLGVLLEVQRNLRGIFVDEFQDTTPEQWRLLRALLTPPRSRSRTAVPTPIACTVVGDPLQSIYGFAGAEPSLFETFLETFPSASCHVLTTNYRSSAAVLTASESLRAGRSEIATTPGGITPWTIICRNEQEEVARITDLVLNTRAQAHTTVGVLARTHQLLAPVEAALVHQGHSVDRRSGRSLMSDPEMRQLFQTLRTDTVGPPARHWHPMLLDHASEGNGAAALLLDLLEEMGTESRGWSVHRLANEIAIWDRHRLHANPVVLSTFHGTKGAAFDTVIIMGMDSRGIPAANAEEDRLLYVATTRARTTLCFTAAETRNGQATQLHPLLQRLASPQSTPAESSSAGPEHIQLHRDPTDHRRRALRTWRTTMSRALMLPETGIASDAELERLASTEELTHHTILDILGAARGERWSQSLLATLISP